jgi:hypothetical protein
VDSCASPTELGEGADQSVTGIATDRAGNTASTTVDGIDIDLTPPAVVVTGVQDDGTYVVGDVPTAGCSTTDALSGVQISAEPSLVDNGDGTFTATCSGASDRAGNAGSASATYAVTAAVHNVAVNTRSVSANSSITATVDAMGVAAGDTITVSVATGTFAGPAACSDNRGNVYAVVADRNTGSGRLFVCSAVASTTLAAGDTVTASYPGFSGVSVISVNAISHLASTGTVDQSTANSGNNANPTSGNVTTTQAHAVIIGVVAHNSTPTFSPGENFTVVGAVSGGSGSGMRTLSPMFRLVTTVDTYAATGTLSSGQQWRAAIVTYGHP